MPKRSRVVGIVKYVPNEVKCVLDVPDGKGTKNNIFLQSVRDKIVQHDIFHPCDESYRAMFGGTKTDVKRAYHKALRKETPHRMTDKQLEAFERQRERMRQLKGKIPRKDGLVIQSAALKKCLKEWKKLGDEKYAEAIANVRSGKWKDIVKAPKLNEYLRQQRATGVNSNSNRPVENGFRRRIAAPRNMNTGSVPIPQAAPIPPPVNDDQPSTRPQKRRLGGI